MLERSNPYQKGYLSESDLVGIHPTIKMPYIKHKKNLLLTERVFYECSIFGKLKYVLPGQITVSDNKVEFESRKVLLSQLKRFVPTEIFYQEARSELNLNVAILDKEQFSLLCSIFGKQLKVAPMSRNADEAPTDYTQPPLGTNLTNGFVVKTRLLKEEITWGELNNDNIPIIPEIKPSKRVYLHERSFYPCVYENVTYYLTPAYQNEESKNIAENIKYAINISLDKFILYQESKKNLNFVLLTEKQFELIRFKFDNPLKIIPPTTPHHTVRSSVETSSSQTANSERTTRKVSAIKVAKLSEGDIMVRDLINNNIDFNSSEKMKRAILVSNRNFHKFIFHNQTYYITIPFKGEDPRNVATQIRKTLKISVDPTIYYYVSSDVEFVMITGEHLEALRVIFHRTPLNVIDRNTNSTIFQDDTACSTSSTHDNVEPDVVAPEISATTTEATSQPIPPESLVPNFFTTSPFASFSNEFQAPQVEDTLPQGSDQPSSFQADVPRVVTAPQSSETAARFNAILQKIIEESEIDEPVNVVNAEHESFDFDLELYLTELGRNALPPLTPMPVARAPSFAPPSVTPTSFFASPSVTPSPFFAPASVTPAPSVSPMPFGSLWHIANARQSPQSNLSVINQENNRKRNSDDLNTRFKPNKKH